MPTPTRGHSLRASAAGVCIYMHKGVEQAAEQDGGAQAETGGGSGDVPPPLDRFGTTGLATTGLWGRISYSFGTPLLTLGARGKVDEGSADAYLPQWETAEVVAAQFDAAYQHEVVSARAWAQAAGAAVPAGTVI